MDLQLLINEAVEDILINSISKAKIDHIIEKQSIKPHFIPIRYRVLGGLLQSMNIQFGNLIEKLITKIIENDSNFEILSDYSGKKSNKYKISVSNEKRIDDYITKCQTSFIDLSAEYNKLLNDIVTDNDINFNYLTHDIDLLFRDKRNGQTIYLEMKYNDDHDTGKFVDINRKFLKTFAYLVNEFKIRNTNDLKPFIFYFTNKRMKGNIYVPENTGILRGEHFFDKFLSVKYSDVENALAKFSENTANIQRFHNLYNNIMSRKI